MWAMDLGEKDATTRYVITHFDREQGTVTLTAVDDDFKTSAADVTRPCHNGFVPLAMNEEILGVWEGEEGATLHGVLK